MGNKIYYKYLDLDGALKSLSNLTLKYSSPQCVNDPTEFFISGFHNITDSDHPKIIKYWQKKYGYQFTCFHISNDINNNENLKTELSDIKKILYKRFYFLSLSQLNNSLSMWYHYADKYKGIVIGYNDEFFPQLHDVKYVKEPPKIKHECVLDDDANHKQLIEILTTKSEAWSYEKEVRDILDMDSNDKRILNFENGIFHIEANFIKDICFGMKCPSNTRKQIQKICKEQHINVHFQK